MQTRAPEHFQIFFATQYGEFTADCLRRRAPVWADRIYNLVANGYYDDNYMFRVLPGFVVQFGTAGVPSVSTFYNYLTTPVPECSILKPQPPDMPLCMEGIARGQSCKRVPGLSNTFGTLVMSTNAKATPEFPELVTWNATAELFINIANNSRLDAKLFVPVCTIDGAGMRTVLDFPSFGEVADLGGPGPSLERLYKEGNPYIEANHSWDSMAKTTQVRLCRS